MKLRLIQISIFLLFVFNSAIAQKYEEEANKLFNSLRKATLNSDLDFFEMQWAESDKKFGKKIQGKAALYKSCISNNLTYELANVELIDGFYLLHCDEFSDDSKVEDKFFLAERKNNQMKLVNYSADKLSLVKWIKK
jgi:hypothetical protein